jgi:hypothetical protein
MIHFIKFEGTVKLKRCIVVNGKEIKYLLKKSRKYRWNSTGAE